MPRSFWLLVTTTRHGYHGEAATVLEKHGLLGRNSLLMSNRKEVLLFAKKRWIAGKYEMPCGCVFWHKEKLKSAVALV
jgi:hypothetical protein